MSLIMGGFEHIAITILAGTLLLGNNILPAAKGTAEREKKLKVQRSRLIPPAQDKIELSISIEQMLNSADKESAFDTGSAARIEGYIFAVTGEKDNCNFGNGSDCDLLIYLAKDERAVQNFDCIVVGITAASKAINPGINLQYLKSIIGKHVVITGWLLYDFPHIASSYESHTYGFKLDRHTVWEIYPLTALKVDE